MLISGLKLFSFSRYLTFVPTFLVIQDKGLRRKLKLILKFMTSQAGKQIITISYYPKSKGNISKFISRTKGNQPIKFGQLIEYKRISIFLEKSHIKCGGEASPRTFHKKLKLRISLDQLSEMLHSLFYLYVQVEVYKNMLKLRC